MKKNPVLEIIEMAWEDFLDLETKQFIEGKVHEYQVIKKQDKELCLKVQGNGRFVGIWQNGIITIEKINKKKKRK